MGQIDLEISKLNTTSAGCGLWSPLVNWDLQPETPASYLEWPSVYVYRTVKVC